jgi:hypothetical protein
VITGASGGAGFMAGLLSSYQCSRRYSSLGMSMYGDLLDDDVSAGEMCGKCGIRGGLEAAETVSILAVV